MKTETLTTENQVGSDAAYPSQPYNGEGYPCGELSSGLTKRELFAAMAMQGLLASGDAEGAHWSFVAEQAKHAADALLKELAK